MTESESTALVTTAGSAWALVAPILNDLPAMDDDPTPRMMAVVLDADPSEWESIFQARSLKASVGKKYRLHPEIRWSQSQYETSRTGIFLICEVTDLDSGERDILTVGGDVAMAQVLGLVKSGRLPWDVAIEEKATPTKSGFKPIHLRSLGKPVAAGKQ